MANGRLRIARAVGSNIVIREGQCFHIFRLSTTVNRGELEQRSRHLFQNNKRAVMKLSRTKNKGGKATTQVDLMLDTGEMLMSVNVRPSRVIYTEDKSYLTFQVRHDPRLTEQEVEALFERALSEMTYDG